METETLEMVYMSIKHETLHYLTELFKRLPETSARQFLNISTGLYALFLKPNVAKNAPRAEEVNFGAI